MLDVAMVDALIALLDCNYPISRLAHLLEKVSASSASMRVLAR